MKNINTIILFSLNLTSSIVIGQKFAIISDIKGVDTNTYNMPLLINSWNPDFTITAGYNHYGSSTAIDNQVGQLNNFNKRLLK